jgi:hypothetical protein
MWRIAVGSGRRRRPRKVGWLEGPGERPSPRAHDAAPAQDPLGQDHAPHPRKIAENDMGNLGDTSTLADPGVVDDLVKNRGG